MAAPCSRPLPVPRSPTRWPQGAECALPDRSSFLCYGGLTHFGGNCCSPSKPLCGIFPLRKDFLALPSAQAFGGLCRLCWSPSLHSTLTVCLAAASASLQALYKGGGGGAQRLSLTSLLSSTVGGQRRAWCPSQVMHHCWSSEQNRIKVINRQSVGVSVLTAHLWPDSAFASLLILPMILWEGVLLSILCVKKCSLERLQSLFSVIE